MNAAYSKQVDIERGEPVASMMISSSGAAILVLGFVVSVFAYRLMHFLGALPDEPRIFYS